MLDSNEYSGSKASRREGTKEASGDGNLLGSYRKGLGDEKMRSTVVNSIQTVNTCKRGE